MSYVKEALGLHLQLAKTSSAKWYALERSHVDGKIIGAFQFFGASRTGREAGRIFQPQNLPRPSIAEPEAVADILADGRYFDALMESDTNAKELLSSTLRAAVKAPEGYSLVVSDLGSIESRVLGWAAGCYRINNTFAKGEDTYKDFATTLYNKAYSDISKAERTMAKPPTLGCGYRLGAKGLVKYADGMGVEMTEEFAQFAVDRYRESFPEVVQMWYSLENAIRGAVLDGLTIDTCRVRIGVKGPFLRIQLPSGRHLHYFKPEMRMVEAPWGDKVENFTFMGMDQFTKKWSRLNGHGGFITENIIQAIARDILFEAMERVSTRLRVIGHVHDEIITLARNGVEDEALAFLDQCLCTPPSWAKDLLLSSEGYISRRYKK